MASINYQVLARRQKIYIRAYAILSALVFLSMTFYTYNKLTEYLVIKEGTAKNNEAIITLRNAVQEERLAFEAEKETFDATNEQISNRLAVIFPASDDYTELTRQFDAYEEELNTRGATFEISSIDFRTAISNGNYSILPVRMNIKSSKDNFTKFLHLIETSGSLSEQVRLMDITSIRLSFSEDNELSSNSQLISFSVQLNAYFQKTN